MPEVIQKAKVELNLPARYDEELAAMAAQMQARISAPSGDVVRINKDKTFSLPSGDTAPELMVIVVDFVSMNQYYPGKFDPKETKPPVCMALGVERLEMQPFATSPQKQNTDCHTCWAGQWGSDGKGKACKEQRLLAVLAPAEQEEGSLMILKVSPTGTRYWDQYVSTYSNNASLPIKGVTLITFDPSLDYASLRFKTVGKNEAWAAAFGRHAEARKRLLTEPELAPKEVAPPPGRGGK